MSGGKFMWTRKYRTTVIERDTKPVVDRLVAEHDGYRRLAGRPVHRRSWEFDKPGRPLACVDEVHAARNRGHAQLAFQRRLQRTCTPTASGIANGPVCLSMMLPPMAKSAFCTARMSRWPAGFPRLRPYRAEHDGDLARSLNGDEGVETILRRI